MILITRSCGSGGVANYYDALRPYLPDSVAYCAIHNPEAKGIISKLINFPKILLRYITLMRQADVVCLNPSLCPNSYYRDMLLLVFAKVSGKRVVIFFRGWDLGFEKLMLSSKFRMFLFRQSYAHADKFIVLGTTFQEKLYAMGVDKSKNFYRVTTVSGVRGLDEEEIKEKYSQNNNPINFLFISRLVSGKGLDDALAIYSGLKKNSSLNMTLTIAGDGPELKRVQQKVKSEGIADVCFTGDVRNEEKSNLLKLMHVLLFPSYGEGLPNTILEAMANGLFIVSTPVGGVPDILEDGQNGLLFDVNELDTVIERLSCIITKQDILLETGIANYKVASSQFAPEVVSKRLLRILSEWE